MFSLSLFIYRSPCWWSLLLTFPKSPALVISGIHVSHNRCLLSVLRKMIKGTNRFIQHDCLSPYDQLTLLLSKLIDLSTALVILTFTARQVTQPHHRSSIRRPIQVNHQRVEFFVWITYPVCGSIWLWGQFKGRQILTHYNPFDKYCFETSSIITFAFNRAGRLRRMLTQIVVFVNRKWTRGTSFEPCFRVVWKAWSRYDRLVCLPRKITVVNVPETHVDEKHNWVTGIRNVALEIA